MKQKRKPGKRKKKEDCKPLQTSDIAMIRDGRVYKFFTPNIKKKC